MPTRVTGQFSLADALAKQASRSGETLERVQSLIDWGQIDTLIAPLGGLALWRARLCAAVDAEGSSAAAMVFAVGSRT